MSSVAPASPTVPPPSFASRLSQLPPTSRSDTTLGAWTETDARTALTRYEGLIRSEARRLRSLALRSNTLDEEDLCAEGRIAVLEALRRFQGWGVNEVTWVRMRVRQRMVDAIRRTSLWSRMDTRVVTRERRGEELSEKDRQRAAVASQRKIVSFDADPGGQAPLADALSDANEAKADDIVDEKRRAQRLQQAIAQLAPRTRRVVESVLLDGRPAREVAAELGVSESRISQILHGAIPQLRARVDIEPEPSTAVRNCRTVPERARARKA